MEKFKELDRKMSLLPREELDRLNPPEEIDWEEDRRQKEEWIKENMRQIEESIKEH